MPRIALLGATVLGTALGLLPAPNPAWAITTKTGTEGGNPWWMWALLIGSLIVAIGIIIYVLTREDVDSGGRSGGSPANTDTTTHTTSFGDSGCDPGSPPSDTSC